MRLKDTLNRNTALRYAGAAALVLVAVLVRTSFDPIFGPRAYYLLYLPPVILSAYLLGAGPAILAIVMASFSGYFLFSEPVLQFKTGLWPHLSLTSFVGSSVVAVFVLAHLRGQLTFLTNEYKRIDALSRSQVELLREHAERVSNHLQLISALLQTHARDEREPGFSRVLMNAASRTMLISRIHRSFVDRGADRVDFRAFAERLAQSVLDVHGRPPIPILIEGKLELATEQATSLALVLVETLNARAALGARGVVRVTLSDEGVDGVLRVIEEGAGEMGRPGDMSLLGAIAEQMRGRLVVGADRESAILHLVFPMQVQPLPAWNPLTPLH